MKHILLSIRYHAYYFHKTKVQRARVLSSLLHNVHAKRELHTHIDNQFHELLR